MSRWIGAQLLLGSTAIFWLVPGCVASSGAQSGTDDSTASLTDSGPRSGPMGRIGGSLLEMGPVQVCEDPVESVTYTERSAELGLEGPIVPTEGRGGSGASVAVADFDQDGDLDMVLGFPDEPLIIYRWEGEAWIKGETFPHTRDTNSMNIADLDGDGWLDLLVGTGGFPRILWNNGGELEWVQQLNTDPQMTRIRELSPADFDGDGDIDLYGLTVTSNINPAERWDMLLRNQGNREFSLDLFSLDRSLATGQGFDAGWFDWDDDGDLDVYVANDQGIRHGPDFLLENQGGGVLQNARDICICGPAHTGMNVDAADFDGDGLFDVFITTASNNVLLKQYGDRSFGDVTLAVGALSVAENDDAPTGWGAMFFDRENDGDLDVLVALGAFSDGEDHDGDVVASQGPLPISLLEQDGGVFTDRGESLGMPQVGTWRSVVTQDFNQDGVLDLLVTELYSRPHLYLSDGCTADSWVRIEAPEGSKVVLTAGDRTWVDHVTRESGYGAGQPANVHIGLGDRDVVDHLEIRVLGGTTLVSDAPFAANRVVRILPAAKVQR